jgi:3-hydroxybutyryl-CoA dehydrogenase
MDANLVFSQREVSDMHEIKTVGIIGAGLMGTGIAEVCALAGFRTILVRVSGSDPAAAVTRVTASMATRVSRGKLDAAAADAATARLTATTSLDELATCDLVIESIVEDLEVKRALLARVSPHLAPHAVLASNTSTLKISDLAAGSHDQRTLGLHFFSPVPAMSLVEVAHLPTTDPDALAAAQAFVEALGKTAVPVLDSCGFIVNRLLVPLLTGAIAAYEQGLAPAEHIDTAMRLGCGHPVGPLALADLIGLDVVYAMAKLLYREFGDDRFRPPALLRRLVQAGHLGKKTRLGLYDYSSKPARANVDALVGERAAA